MIYPNLQFRLITTHPDECTHILLPKCILALYKNDLYTGENGEWVGNTRRPDHELP